MVSLNGDAMSCRFSMAMLRAREHLVLAIEPALHIHLTIEGLDHSDAR